MLIFIISPSAGAGAHTLTLIYLYTYIDKITWPAPLAVVRVRQICGICPLAQHFVKNDILMKDKRKRDLRTHTTNSTFAPYTWRWDAQITVKTKWIFTAFDLSPAFSTHTLTHSKSADFQMSGRNKQQRNMFDQLFTVCNDDETGNELSWCQ